MKYRVLLDRGVDVAGHHYGHDAVIDDKKIVDNKDLKAAAELAALAKDGSIVEDAGKGKE
jgi:hypothetical protein